MKKMLVAAVCAVALVGCGGPLEDEGAATTGKTQQELLALEAPPPMPGDHSTPQVNTALVRSPQEVLVGAKSFQERQHLNNPFDPNCH